MKELSLMNLTADPISSFENWFVEASKVEKDAAAFCLATQSIHGPRGRMLLYKGIQEDGFSFFTHETSHKGDDLKNTPKAEMIFYWPNSGKQIRIFGEVKVLSEASSDKQFYSRPIESQVASAISKQSQELLSREHLVSTYEKELEKAKKSGMKRPVGWIGYVVLPAEIEFFMYGDHRLNHRILFTKNEKHHWYKRLLWP